MSHPCAVLLASLLQYARHPATSNAPRWVSILVPEDFLPEAEKALAQALRGREPKAPCVVCDGSGWVEDNQCRVCRGRG